MADLRSEAERMAEVLMSAGQRLKDEGILPPDEIADSLAQLRIAADELFMRVSGGRTRESHPRNVHDVLRTAEQWLQCRSRTAEAERWLRVCACVTSRNPDDEPMLAEIRRQALRLTERLASPEPPDESWFREAEPHIALARLLTEDQTLSDEEWMASEELVRKELGDKVATALLRKRLYAEAAPAAANFPAGSEGGLVNLEPSGTTPQDKVSATTTSATTATKAATEADTVDVAPSAKESAAQTMEAKPTEDRTAETKSKIDAEKATGKSAADKSAGGNGKQAAPGKAVKPDKPNHLTISDSAVPSQISAPANSLAVLRLPEITVVAEKGVERLLKVKMNDRPLMKHVHSAESERKTIKIHPEKIRALIRKSREGQSETQLTSGGSPVQEQTESERTEVTELRNQPELSGQPELMEQPERSSEPSRQRGEESAHTAESAVAVEPAAISEKSPGQTAGQPVEQPGWKSVRQSAEQAAWQTDHQLAGNAAWQAEESSGSTEAWTKEEQLLWQWIRDRQLPQSYRLARHLWSRSDREDRRRLPELILAAFLAQHVRHNTGAIAFRLKGMFEDWLAGGFAERDKDSALEYLMAAAALKPAILAPNTNALQILEQIQFKGNLYNFTNVIKAYASHFIPLDPYVLHHLKTEAGWNEDLENLKKRTEQSIRLWQTAKFLFQPASKVWMKWMEPNGWVHAKLTWILHHETGKMEEARQFIDRYSDPNEFRSRVHFTDREEIGRQAGRDITARALNQLYSHFLDAMDLIREWISLIENQPGHNNEYQQQKAKELENGVRQYYDLVIGELREQASGAGEDAVKAGLAVLEWAVRQVFALFDPNTPITHKEPEAEYVLNRPLLGIPTVGIRSDWTLYDEEAFPVGELVSMMETGLPPFGEAFEARLKRRDVEGCQLMLETVTDEELAELGLVRDGLEERMNTELKEYRNALRDNIRKTAKQVEVAFTHNLINDHDRNRYLADLLAMERSVDQILYFPKELAQLSELEDTLNRKREEVRDRLRRQFAEANVTESHPYYDKIQQILESGNLYTAQELLTRIQNNETLEFEDKDREPFREFFDPQSSVFQDLVKMLEETPMQRIIEWVRHGKSFGPLDMGQVPGAQCRQAAEMLEAWMRAKRSAGKTVVEDRDIRGILNNIGLSVKSVERVSTPRKNRDYQIIHTETLADHNRCPVPHYGSGAAGQYRLFAIWERLTEEDIIHEIGDTGHGQLPAIVFFFGRLTAMRRRELARLCRERRRTFIILDEVLLLYLCGERGSRLPVFFKLALPFTYLEPYQTTASLVPPEMFFGRKAELQSIMEGRSGLVYGGRQLGKTALLLEARRRFHAPDEDRYAVWIDLRAEGIGYNKFPDDIWNVIAKELNRVGLNEINPNVNSAEKLFQQIQDWLDQKRQRRILLLLDEADRFLEMDAREMGKAGEEAGRSGAGFIRCSKIKGLMEKTNKRFHVVFAGLHNVQRSYKNQNDPLAHLGHAICVGPLISEGEWKEAHDLITKPLEALGYFFDTPELVLQILSQTNYYPSLIQLYCHQLLRHLLEHRALVSFPTKQTPPYYITAKHVDEAYQDRELQQAIRHRFHLTLQLDPRYKLIAYILAHESLTDEETARQGLTVKQILSLTRDYWQDGFSNMAVDSFRVLLDEMVDLGVLRRVREGYYSLRSPNLISLMGTLSEIEDELLREDRDLWTEYDAAHFRPTYQVNADSGRSHRSPLTAEQESELMQSPNRVAVIFGHYAAGIHEVEAYFQDRQKAGQLKLKVLHGLTEKSALLRELKEIGDARAENLFVLVGLDGAWTMEWVLEAKALIESSKRYDQMRLVFLADSGQTFSLVRQNPDLDEEMFRQGILILQLKPWHPTTLGLWLSDCELEHTRQVIELIEKATGNWPGLLYRLHAKTLKNPHQLRQHVTEFERELLEQDMLAAVLGEFGLQREETVKVFQLLALDSAGEETIAQHCDLSLELVRSILVSAELLGTAKRVGRGYWKADPLLSKLLLEAGDRH
jgi:hypothetical protein